MMRKNIDIPPIRVRKSSLSAWEHEEAYESLSPFKKYKICQKEHAQHQLPNIAEENSSQTKIDLIKAFIPKFKIRNCTEDTRIPKTKTFEIIEHNLVSMQSSTLTTKASPTVTRHRSKVASQSDHHGYSPLNPEKLIEFPVHNQTLEVPLTFKSFCDRRDLSKISCTIQLKQIKPTTKEILKVLAPKEFTGQLMPTSVPRQSNKDFTNTICYLKRSWKSRQLTENKF